MVVYGLNLWLYVRSDKYCDPCLFIVTLSFSFFLSFHSTLHLHYLPCSLPACPPLSLERLNTVSQSLLLLHLLPFLLNHNLLLTPPFSSLTGSWRQPCLVLDEWELSASSVWMCYQCCLHKRMWMGVYKCDCKTSFLSALQILWESVYRGSFVHWKPCGVSILCECIKE